MVSNPLRSILRKKKSVTFHPSTKASPSTSPSPAVYDGAQWSMTDNPSSPVSGASTTTAAPGPTSTTTRRRSPRRGPPPTTPLAALPHGSPLPSTAPSTTTTTGTAALLKYADLPPWQRDNPLITTGYRPTTHSHLATLGTLFAWHNETCNIWTHLAGLLIFSLLGGALLHDLESWFGPAATAGDWWALAAFFGGVGACYAASAGYHLFSAVGPAAARVWNGVDYAGIVACIWGSFVATLHFGFPDDDDGQGEGGEKGGVDVGRERRRVYEIMITVLGLVCATVSVTPRFRTPAWRPFRALMFVLMGLSAAAPVLHGLMLFGVAQLDRQMGLSWVVLQGLLYIVGAALYAARIPERFAAPPGRYDVLGASHQIFHLLIVLAAAAQLVGLLKALQHACATRQQQQRHQKTT